ncbi:MAG: hypothetical protein JWL66_729 [Sphingomonadales bacterium]|nr:hypothetical protein [Sphingomonadales bacterium]
MIILLPLALIGIGAFVHFFLNAASHTLALAVGFAAALASAHGGCSATAAMLIGIAAFMLVTGLARFVALTGSLPARIAVVAALAIPAALAGYKVGHGLAGLSSLPTLIPALASAALTGLAAASRIGRPAS